MVIIFIEKADMVFFRESSEIRCQEKKNSREFIFLNVPVVIFINYLMVLIAHSNNSTISNLKS